MDSTTLKSAIFMKFLKIVEQDYTHGGWNTQMYTMHGQSGKMMDLNSIKVITYKARFEFNGLRVHKYVHVKYFESKESTTKNNN
jgi:hypothetical protein